VIDAKASRIPPLAGPGSKFAHENSAGGGRGSEVGAFSGGAPRKGRGHAKLLPRPEEQPAFRNVGHSCPQVISAADERQGMGYTVYTRGPKDFSGMGVRSFTNPFTPPASTASAMVVCYVSEGVGIFNVDHASLTEAPAQY
jgi:hypothetical protein